jgi:hypothetical protein
MERNGSVGVANDGPARPCIGEATELHNVATSTGADHRCKPQVIVFSDKIDTARLKLFGKLSDLDRFERAWATPK